MAELQEGIRLTRGKLARHQFLLLREHVHGHVPTDRQPRVHPSILLNANEHQWRIERQRRKRRYSNAGIGSLELRSDHRHPGGKMPHRPAEFSLINCHRGPSCVFECSEAACAVWHANCAERIPEPAVLRRAETYRIARRTPRPHFSRGGAASNSRLHSRSIDDNRAVQEALRSPKSPSWYGVPVAGMRRFRNACQALPPCCRSSAFSN